MEGLHNSRYIYAGDGDDFIQGFNGKDTIYDGNGNDVIRTGNGNDMIFGEAGDDILQSVGLGLKTLDGGEGIDLCVPEYKSVKTTSINCEITS
ncbi:MAG: hypothetical protein MJK05_05200 [Nitrosopumilus sp.]|nr:hypothetical protein [Nitrosopumilus sp.]